MRRVDGKRLDMNMEKGRKTEGVIVIGGGISGLACAWTLKRAGVKVSVIEAFERVGGDLRTEKAEGYTLETGPHSWIPSADAVWSLIAEAGMEDAVQKASTLGDVRFVWRDGRLNPLPMSAASFIGSRILTIGGKLRLMIEPFIRGGASEEDTAEDFFRRRLGAEAVRWLIGPFVSGVYAGDPKELGARDAFPKMWSWERDAGSMIIGARRYMKEKAKRPGYVKRRGLFTFKGGLCNLPDSLAADLGASVFTGEAARSLEKNADGWTVETESGKHEAGRIVLAVPPNTAAGLLGPVSQDAGDILAMMKMAPVAVLHLGIEDADAGFIPDAFGFLVPRGQGIRTLGVVFISKLYPDRAPEGRQLLTCFIGGVFDPEALLLPDRELLESVLDDLGAMLGRKPAVAFYKVLRHPHAIPQLTVGHLDRVEKLRGLIRQLGGMHLAGNYLTGVGMNDAVRSGRDAAEEVITLFKGGDN